MSTIEDWSTTASSNTPADATALGSSGATALSDVAFLDTKAVIRSESLRTGWEPDAWTISHVSSQEFDIAGEDLRGTYHPGQAVKIQRSGGEILGGYIEYTDLVGGTDTRFKLYDIRTDKGVGGALSASIESAWFSVRRPRGVPTIVAALSYPGDLPSLIPGLWQTVTVKIEGSGNPVGRSGFLYPFQGTDYFVSAQCVGYSGSPSIGAFALKTLNKRDESIVFRLVAAPGTGASVTWQISAYYQIGG